MSRESINHSSGNDTRDFRNIVGEGGGPSGVTFKSEKKAGISSASNAVGPNPEHDNGWNNNTAEEVEAERAKLTRPQRVGRMALKVMALLGVTAALYFGADKEPNKGLPKEAWENAMQKETAGYGANISYGEDGSAIEFVEHYGDKQNYVVLIDGNNDTLINEGYMSSSEGGAEIASENGYTFKGALQLLHDKMDKEN